MRRFASFAWLCFFIAGATGLAGPSRQSRDSRAAGQGARVSGVVVSAEDGRQPIRRAMVSLAGPSQISQITDEDGRFVFESLAAGEYAITATRAGFLPAEYGARRPGRLAARLSVAAGATVNDVTLYMARGAVIEGVVRDVNGQPAANVSVIVSSPATVTQFVTGLSTPWMTDDRGVYRAYGLAPGSYVVLATPPVVRRGEIVQPSAAAMDAALRSLTDRSGAALTPVVLPPFATTVAYGPIFHPGSPTLAQAGVITIAAGEERRGIDVNLMLVPTRAIEGRVLDPSGQPATQIQLFISGNGTPSPMFDAAPIMTGRSTTLGPGRFRYTNVTAGRYTVTAKRPGDPPLWAQAQVDVSGADVTGLELHLQPGLSLRGRLVFDGQTLAPPANLASVRITIAPPTGGGGGMANLTNYGLGTSMAVNADDDGFFQIGGVIPGDYVVGSFIPGNPATGWWLRSAMVNGVDAVDLPAAIDGAVNGDIVLTFSDRHSELSGTLSTPAGLPTTDYYVVVIPADPTLWRGAARRMKIARPSTAGRYVFTDVPPGEYLVSAVTDFAASDFKDRTILEQLAGAAVKVRIADGERVVQDLRIGGKDPRPGPADQVELLTLSVQRHHLALAAPRSCPPCSF